MEDLGGQTYSTRLCVVVLQRNLANIIAHGSGAPIASAGELGGGGGGTRDTGIGTFKQAVALQGLAHTE